MNTKVTLDCQLLRNITTGIFHVKSVYDTQAAVAKLCGIMTDPRNLIPLLDITCKILKTKNLPDRFWDGQYDPTHTGTITFNAFTEEEKMEVLNYFENYL